MNTKNEYERDFYSWTLHSAQLLREGNFLEVDIENVAEEIESMGRRDRRLLVNRIAVLISHLLKWQHQPIRRSNSWKLTINGQRNKVFELLEESPSLKYELEKKIDNAYEKSILIVARETGLSSDTFPSQCPFNFEQYLNKKFFPE